MAVTKVLCETQVDAVLETTKSIDTCSTSTLRLLRALLGIEDAIHDVPRCKLAEESTERKQTVSTAATKSTKKSNRPNNAKFTILDCPEAPVQCLPRNKRLALATTTFNKTLKNLGGALKTTKTSSCEKSGVTRSPLKETQGRIAAASNPAFKPANPRKHLKSKSPELQGDKAQPTARVIHHTGLLTTAKCAQTSLQCLRQLKAEGCATGEQDNHLEQGALVLISKLHGLGLIASAIEETLNVRRSLERPRHVQQQSRRDDTRSDKHRIYGSLIDCIEFGDFGDNAETFGLITAFQVQVLQLIAVDDKSLVDENLLLRLDPTNPRSPCHILLHSAEREWIPVEKAAFQIHSLSQSILTICSFPSNGAPETHPSHVSPDVLFRLQCLALEIRCHWWQFAHHQPDIDKEIWAPFHHFVVSLRRRYAHTTKPRFLQAKCCLDRLLDVLSKNRHPSTVGIATVQPPSAVISALQNMAEATGSNHNTLDLLLGLKDLCGGLSGLPVAIYHCRLANALLLDSASGNNKFILTLETTLDLLGTSLKGTTTELEELLLQASRLRKAAAIRLTATIEDLRTTHSDDGSNSRLSSLCIRVIIGVLHFVVRFVGLTLQGGGNANATAKSCQRQQCSMLVAQQSMKSALAAVQSNITHEYVGWQTCIAALADCISIAKILDENGQDIADADVNQKTIPSAFLRVSNLYWSWYLKQKDASACTSDLATTLHSSVQALQGCRKAERRIGFLAVKCDKAAVLYMELKQYSTAHKILATAIDACLDDGTLSAAAQKVSTQSPTEIWGGAQSSESMLGRVLLTYARLILKHHPDSSHPIFFDKARLKTDERALLLERQFFALRETLVPQNLHARLKEVAEIVLSLRSESSVSSHRLRFISELLTFCSKNHLRPREFLPKEALAICMDGSDEDLFKSEEGAFASARSLHMSLLLQWAFQTGIPSAALLQAFVNSHTVVADSCSDWTAILSSINDPALVVVQVQSVVDFSDMKGLLQIKLGALLLMRHLLELQPERDISALTSCISQIGLQYTRMGLTSQAGRALAVAEASLEQTKFKSLIALQWHLVYAEYLTALSSYEKAADHLVSAQWRYEADFMSDHEYESRCSRLAQHKYLAQAAYVASNLAFANGDLDRAVLYAKKSVRLSVRQWSVLEKLLRVNSSCMGGERSDSRIDGLVGDLSNLTLSNEDQARNPSSKAAAFWASVQMHFDGLLHLSRLSAHNGNSQDAVYYAEQAKKVGDATGSDVLIWQVSSLLAAHLALAGRLDGDQLMLDSCTTSYGIVGHCVQSAQAYMAMASAHLARGEFTRGVEALEKAQRTISEIQAADHPGSLPSSEEKSSVKAVRVKQAPRSASRITRKALKPHHSPAYVFSRETFTGAKDVALDEAISGPEGNTWIQRLRIETGLLKCCLCIRSGSREDDGDVLDQLIPFAGPHPSGTWHFVLQARTMLNEALRLFESDAVYSVLAESTIAYPTRQSKPTSDLQHGGTAFNNPTGAAVTMPPCSDKRVKNRKVLTQSGMPNPKELVSKARNLLLRFLSSSLPSSSSIVANELSSLLTRVELLSSVLSAAVSPSPFQLTCHLNVAKSLRWSREVASIDADISLSDNTTVFEWPETHDLTEAASAGPSLTLDFTVLQHQLQDTLPPSWNVVTVAMSNDDSEILIAKIRQGQSPFVLRLPLDRTASGDLDEESFKFHTAKSEMDDIIVSANLTAHDAKARSDKQGKKDWWTAREALDARLASLLHNMETLWLGGFRGIFSDQCHKEELLLRFSEALMRTLDRQLPSRRKTSEKKAARYELHTNVLELFVALGNPDEGDLDDAITDLLYFVVDILQFQGECNAYDEVDFDAIVLEVKDALRSFHDAAKNASAQPVGHTILILDKALHAFPWESLQCLEGQSVTRMPSLGCLQERLLGMRQDEKHGPGVYIDPQNGAYILNPSSDLTWTQESFLDPFSRTLASYTSIVNRPPSETEFETCIRDKDLCLYFGHGSGAQFIRGRTIKRLKKCAVTFLMGCSSSKMVECGQFEPYGMPYNYLYAGSAAVVGTLWDVTDKDIDRFAMETFVNWGLLAPDVVKEDTKKDKARKMKTKGRGKKQKTDLRRALVDEGSENEVGLDDAVAKARGACLLRYLNGAAPVIYGIPVYLHH